MRRAIALGVLGVLGATMVTVTRVNAATPSITWSPSDAPVAPGATQSTSKSEVSVGIDPSNPDRVIAGVIDNRPLTNPASRVFGTWLDSIFTSADGGRSWSQRGHAPPVGNNGQPVGCDDPVEADPWVSFDERGTAYFSYMTYDGGDPTAARACRDWTLSVITSTDGGMTWTPPVVVVHALPDGSCAPDRDALMTDPNSGVVVLTWASIGCPGDPLMMSHSSDSGRTWSPAVALSAATDIEPYGATPRPGPDGRILVGYYRGAPFDGCPYVIGTTATNPVSAEAVVAITKDFGATWERHVVAPVCDDEYQTTEQPFEGGADFSWPMMGSDPASGVAAIAWSNRDRPFSTAHVSVSRDGGATWATPVALGDTARGAYMPSVAVTGQIVHVLYLSMLSTGHFDAVYRSSLDAGASWGPSVTLDTKTSCNCWGALTDATLAGRIGDYQALDARAGRIVAAWPDTRDPTKPTNVFTRVGAYDANGVAPALATPPSAPQSLPPTGGPSALVGLALCATALLMRSLVRRRRVASID